MFLRKSSHRFILCCSEHLMVSIIINSNEFHAKKIYKYLEQSRKRNNSNRMFAICGMTIRICICYIYLRLNDEQGVFGYRIRGNEWEYLNNTSRKRIYREKKNLRTVCSLHWVVKAFNLTTRRHGAYVKATTRDEWTLFQHSSLALCRAFTVLQPWVEWKSSKLSYQLYYTEKKDFWPENNFKLWIED